MLFLPIMPSSVVCLVLSFLSFSGPFILGSGKEGENLLRIQPNRTLTFLLCRILRRSVHFGEEALAFVQRLVNLRASGEWIPASVCPWLAREWIAPCHGSVHAFALESDRTHE